MELLLELLLELFGEVAWQVLAELLAEWGLHLNRERHARRALHPLLSLLGYAVLGLAAGALSLWLLPQALLPSPGWRVANLLLSPLLSGAVLTLIAHWRRPGDPEVLLRTRFMQGLLFALAMAAVRFAATA
ncbi:hypothetical protein PSQ39_04955 [Curvibacter sp. HBC28]|uniref:Uncharacterized protein n=1 Tax=Curvibacter microcysteis TaxID=3026419 RepID=A0ABT5MDP0_9BURK|nr:hypothetical protein [Curvibacter sp. HBC28]MDD0813974.1 hypothetical protein [Curvibacter sp. HBC28]